MRLYAIIATAIAIVGEAVARGAGPVPVYPASTNGDNIFTGINTFRQSIQGTATNASAVAAGVTNAWQSYANGVTNGFPWSGLYDPAGAAAAATNGWPWAGLPASSVAAGVTNAWQSYANGVISGKSQTNVTLYGDTYLSSLSGATVLSITGDSPGVVTGKGTWNLETVTATNFTGDGSGLTSLNAGNLTGTISITNGTRVFLHDSTHTLITNSATLTAAEWTAGQHKEWYNGSITVLTDKTNGTIAAKSGFIGSGANLTNLFATNITGRAISATNYTVASGTTIDATMPYTGLITNASYSVAGFSGLVTAYRHVFSVTVSNSANSAITVTGPLTTFYFGSGTATQTIPAGKQGIWSYWILPGLVTNCANILQQ